MADTLEGLQRRRTSANELAAVVRTMKAMAASNISQYEMAVEALKAYYQTVLLGIKTCRRQTGSTFFNYSLQKEQAITGAIVFGSDQGLVGNFNDALAGFVHQHVQLVGGTKEVWAVGERVYNRLIDCGLNTTRLFSVPNSVAAITQLVNELLLKSEEGPERKRLFVLDVFHNRPRLTAGYEQVSQRLLPLESTWQQESASLSWPSKNLPQVIGAAETVLPALLREYLFVSLYKSCAESLASENRSRLEAMQRAEKNIDDMLNGIGQTYNSLRQATIDEELFDVVAGFEALKK